MKFYAGIGSRTTPEDILAKMSGIAIALDARAGSDFTLRSGGAKGADTAFAKGAKRSIILRPHHATEAAIEMASKYHPAWHNCNDYVRKLHGRNAQIILGENLDSPVLFVLCWTPKGNEVGGTALGIRIAKDKVNNIPVFNLAIEGTIDKLKEFLNGNVA